MHLSKAFMHLTCVCVLGGSVQGFSDLSGCMYEFHYNCQRLANFHFLLLCLCISASHSHILIELDSCEDQSPEYCHSWLQYGFCPLSFLQQNGQHLDKNYKQQLSAKSNSASSSRANISGVVYSSDQIAKGQLLDDGCTIGVMKPSIRTIENVLRQNSAAKCEENVCQENESCRGSHELHICCVYKHVYPANTSKVDKDIHLERVQYMKQLFTCITPSEIKEFQEFRQLSQDSLKDRNISVALSCISKRVDKGIKMKNMKKKAAERSDGDSHLILTAKLEQRVSSDGSFDSTIDSVCSSLSSNDKDEDIGRRTHKRRRNNNGSPTTSEMSTESVSDSDRHNSHNSLGSNVNSVNEIAQGSIGSNKNTLTLGDRSSYFNNSVAMRAIHNIQTSQHMNERGMVKISIPAKAKGGTVRSQSQGSISLHILHDRIEGGAQNAARHRQLKNPLALMGVMGAIGQTRNMDKRNHGQTEKTEKTETTVGNVGEGVKVGALPLPLPLPLQHTPHKSQKKAVAVSERSDLSNNMRITRSRYTRQEDQDYEDILQGL